MNVIRVDYVNFIDGSLSLVIRIRWRMQFDYVSENARVRINGTKLLHINYFY